MLPTVGRTVLYHFTHLEYTFGGMTSSSFVESQRVRPAIVIAAEPQTGTCDLHVFYRPDDWNRSNNSRGEPCVLAVKPHCEISSEIGKIEREAPKPNTWSWLPRA